MLIRNTSISFRLAAWFSTILFLGWLLFGVAMRFDLEHTLTAGRYQTLSRRADRLSDLLQRFQGQPYETRALEFQEFASATGDGLIEIFKSDGARAFPSPSAEAAAFPWPRISDRELFLKAKVRGQGYRIMSRPIMVGNEKYFACLAAPLSGNLAILQRFTFGLLVAMPVLLIASAVCGYFVCRQALSPVDRITALARNISVWSLSDRLPVPRTHDELQRLAETCNEMLGRLDTAVAQIRNFTSNASHELRSPLSFTRTLAEVALLNPLIDGESAQTFGEIVKECTKATAVLEDLLILARADSDRGSVRFEPLSLETVAKEACQPLNAHAQEHGHTIRCRFSGRPGTLIRADAEILKRLIGILLDNALKYTQGPDLIEVGIESGSDTVTLSVQDHGIGIPESDLPHVFERFYRSDRARDVAEGSGLGLAIAKWIADIHHAELKVTSKPGVGTRVDVLFPAYKDVESYVETAI